VVWKGREWGGLGYGGGKAGEVLEMITRNVMNFNAINLLSNKRFFKKKEKKKKKKKKRKERKMADLSQECRRYNN